MSSRLHKIGSIYSRLRGLLRDRKISQENKPMWYDIYTHFPPVDEPVYERPVKNHEIRKILYEEDEARAQIHKALHDKLGPIDLCDNNTETTSQKMIKAYKTYISEGMSEEEAMQKLCNDT